MTAESSSPLDSILTRCRRLLRTPHALAVLASVWVLGSVMLALGIAVTMKLAGQRAFTSSSATPMAYGLTQKHSLILLVTAVSLHLVLLMFLLGSILSDRPSSVHPHRQSPPVREEDGTKTEDTATTFEKDLPPCYEAVLLAETPPPPFHSTIWRTPSIESLVKTSCLNSYVTLPLSESLIPDADRPKMTSCDSKNTICDIDDDVAYVQDFAEEKITNIKTDNGDEVFCGSLHQPVKKGFLETGSCLSLLNNAVSNNDTSKIEENIAYLSENENFESTSTNPNYKRNHKEIYVKIYSTENLRKKCEGELSSKTLYDLAERQKKIIITVSRNISASRSSNEIQRHYSLKTPSTSKLVNNSKVLLSHPFKEESHKHFSANQDPVEDLEHDIIYKQKNTNAYKTVGDHSFEIMPLLHNKRTVKQNGTNMSHHTITKPQNSRPETPLLPVLTLSTENISYACTSLPPHTHRSKSSTLFTHRPSGNKESSTLFTHRPSGNKESSTLFTHRPSRNKERDNNKEYSIKGSSQPFLLPRFQPVLNPSNSVSNQSLESGIHSCSSLVTSHVGKDLVNADSKDSVNSYEIVNDSPKITPDSAIGSTVSVNICL